MPEYKTKQKELILECLIENKNIHLTAGDISVHLREKGNAIGTSTIYRHLDKLVSAGSVKKYIVDENSPACYQYIGDDEQCCEHFHLKCTSCGQLIHTQCSLLKKITEHMMQDHGFMIDSTKTLLYGKCKDCRNKDIRR